MTLYRFLLSLFIRPADARAPQGGLSARTQYRLLQVGMRYDRTRSALE